MFCHSTSEVLISGAQSWTGWNETSLIVTPPGQSRLSADSLVIAQFLYTLLRNPSTLADRLQGRANG